MCREPQSHRPCLKDYSLICCIDYTINFKGYRSLADADTFCKLLQCLSLKQQCLAWDTHTPKGAAYYNYT